MPAGLADRLVGPFVDEAKAALADGIVADADLVDAGAIFGTGFAPFRGGPLQLRGQPRLSGVRPVGAGRLSSGETGSRVYDARPTGEAAGTAPATGGCTRERGAKAGPRRPGG